MLRRSLLLTLVLLAAAPAAHAATKNGITPLSPKAGATVPEGRSPTFRMKAEGPGTVWVHVCKSARKRADGTICSTPQIGQARKSGSEYRFKPKFFNFETFWLNTP